MYNKIVEFIQSVFQTNDFIPLHEPRFCGNEKKYLADCIDSTFVSSVGKYVDQFEVKCKEFTGAKHAIAVVNGTQALFIALKLSGVTTGTEVITQSLTFVATANAIRYTGAVPIFIDVDKDTMGLSPICLKRFLDTETEMKNGKRFNVRTKNQLVACVPMHTFGVPCRIREIKQICEDYQISLVEDSAESLGSYVGDVHTGLFGKFGILSFNGNKIITTGGGGIILTDNESLAKKAKHLTTTAKIPHPWEFIHDEIGYNFRMPNLNAALGVAQLEQLPGFLDKKKRLAEKYYQFFDKIGIKLIGSLDESIANNWLNAIVLDNRKERDEFLRYSNEAGVMTRGLWTPMHLLPMYASCQSDDLSNTVNLYDRVVNIPSSVN